MGAGQFHYDPAPNSGALRQGELLADIWIPVPLHPPVELDENTEVPVEGVHHPYVFVMSPDCDLDWDFKARFLDDDARENYRESEKIEKPESIVPVVLLCDATEKPGLKARFKASKLWDRIQGNHDKRYHHLEAAEVKGNSGTTLPDLYLDFKKINAVATRQFYEGIRLGVVRRLAVVPTIYLQDLIHRFYFFQSRIALPE